MKCDWKALLSILPVHLREEVDRHGSETLQELRLRLGKVPELVTAMGRIDLGQTVTADDIQFVINTASRYSPWAAATAARGFITANGGHRIGICGQAILENGQVKSQREINSLCIRVARDFPGIANGLKLKGNLLVLGPPGAGKTTILRDLCRRLAETETVGVVDERGELFPRGFSTGKRMDVIRGCGKVQAIDMLLRTMGPQTIAVDEITAQEDTVALQSAGWCGVRLLATAHASGKADLLNRRVYRPLVESGLFDELLILRTDKSWYLERMMICC